MDRKVYDEWVNSVEGTAEYCAELTKRNKNSSDPLVWLFFGPQSLSAFPDSDKRPAFIDVPSPLDTMTEVEIMVEYLGMTEEEAVQTLQFRDVQENLRKYENLRRDLLQ